MSSPVQTLIEEIEEYAAEPLIAARRLRSAALEILDEVNRLERKHSERMFEPHREWHIARYQDGET